MLEEVNKFNYCKLMLLITHSLFLNIKQLKKKHKYEKENNCNLEW